MEALGNSCPALSSPYDHGLEIYVVPRLSRSSPLSFLDAERIGAKVSHVPLDEPLLRVDAGLPGALESFDILRGCRKLSRGSGERRHDGLQG